MPSDTYILTISDAGVSVPSSHASTHISGGSDAIPTATSTTSGLMSAAIFNQHTANTAKTSNVTHTGDVTDTAGVLTVNKINGVSMAGLATGIVKNTTGTGAPSIAIAADFPILNQSTTGNAATATLATTATNIAGGSTGAVPYQTGSGTTALLSAGTAGYVLKSNGSAAPSWAPVDLSAGISGSLPVSSGGTGAATFTAGILRANGTSAFTTITAPSGDLVGTTDIQTLTNKTFGTGTTFSSTIGVASGGTGAATFTAGILRANGTSAFTTITAPSGDLVGTTDAQTLTNKTFGTGTVFSTAVTATNGGTGQSSYTIGDILFADTASTLSKLSGVATGNAIISGGVGVAPSYGKIGLTTHVSGTLPVANGGTGVTTSTGTGANVLATSPALVTPALGTPTSGVLTSCTGLPLTTGVTGTLPVANGGTGQSTLTGYVKGTGTTAMTASATVPVGDISGILPVAKGGTGYGVDGIGTLSFDTTPDTGTALTEGQLRWNATEKTLDLKMAGTAVTQQIGQELLMRVHSASAISNGQVVYISGSNAGLPSVTVASADSVNARKTLGVATEDIGVGSDGYIALSGLVRGLDLSGYSAGQELWLANSGAFTGTEAAYPDFKIRIGFVVLNTDGDGSFFVAPKFFENGYVNGTGKIGYITGAGGTVTQLTSRATPVTLNKTTGQITLFAATLGGHASVPITLNNTKIEAGDVLILNHISGGANFGKYSLNARTSANSAIIDVTNLDSTGLPAESITIAFAVIKSVTS